MMPLCNVGDALLLSQGMNIYQAFSDFDDKFHFLFFLLKYERRTVFIYKIVK